MNARRLASLAVTMVLAAVAVRDARDDEPLELYATGRADRSLERIQSAPRPAGRRRVRRVGTVSRAPRERRTRGRIRIGEHGASAIARRRRQDRTGATVARNRLCALAAPAVGLSRDNLLDRPLDPAVKLGMSTPRADPSGDYAVEMFAKADKIRPGARAALTGKALQLTGGTASPAPPTDRSAYGTLIGEHKADVMLTYCSNAVAAQRENASLNVIDLSESLAVGASHGITVMSGASANATHFVQFVLGADGQRVLARHGFESPG